MYSDAQLERYVQQARKMRSEYIAALFHRGFSALSRVIRRARRVLARGLRSAARTLEPRRQRPAS